MRFEEPNAMTRWDSPLFIIPSGGDPPEPAPLDEIWAACTTGAPKKANMATVPVSSSEILNEGAALTDLRLSD